jgi:hypothetical protein
MGLELDPEMPAMARHPYDGGDLPSSSECQVFANRVLQLS